MRTTAGIYGISRGLKFEHGAKIRQIIADFVKCFFAVVSLKA